MAMKSWKSNLLSSTAIPVLIGAGIAVGGAVMLAGAGSASSPGPGHSSLLPVAKPRPLGVQLAACNPCNPCNPCAAKNPCNPCAAENPCNPCAGAATGVSSKCFVPRLRTAALGNPCAAKNPCNPCAAKNPCNPCAANNPCNPCAAKNPCNPCAAKNPCNPCAAKNPCNPCAAKNPCNPCAAKNPCNPCAGAEAAEISPAEAKGAYDCLVGELKAAYAKAGLTTVKDYTRWTNVNTAPYQSATHGSRYVNNYANKRAASFYVKFEESGKMPAGAVLAKDSFVVHPDGRVGVGPLFVMEKMNAGFSAASGDWRYTMVMPDGSKFGETKGENADRVKFCVGCHVAAEDTDNMFFLPEEYRARF